MDFFDYKDGVLHCEEIAVDDICNHVKTPTYIYSRRTILHHYRRIAEAFEGANPLICYSVKSNSNISVCSLLANEGAGFDVVSGGELFRALQAGGDPQKIVYAGIGKTDSEIEYALSSGILMFNVESAEELTRIEAIARTLQTTAQVALRVNPDVDAHTHAYITTGKKENKFGIGMNVATELATGLLEKEHIKLVGLHMHIGSQITTIEPYVESLERVTSFLHTCRQMGHYIDWLNIGGGFGIFYRGSEAKTAAQFGEKIVPIIKEANCRLIMEPGRFIVGNAGILATRVIGVKKSREKTFIICDAGMNDLVRPSLYKAFHKIWPTRTQLVPDEVFEPEDVVVPKDGTILVDVVGPVCETGDVFAEQRPMPPVQAGDLLAIFSAGAYGMVMSSNYNSRPRSCETLVDGSEFQIVRRRESYEDLVANETDL